MAGLARRWRQKQIDDARRPYADTRPRTASFFSDDRSMYADQVTAQLPDCALVHLHWVAGLIDYRTFFQTLPPHVPIVWTLHDMNPFTGGCHVAYDCDQYRGTCGSCPQLGSHDAGDLTNVIHDRKRQAFDTLPADRLHIVTPSRWMADQARNSSLLARYPITHIPYGVDTTLFAPRDRRFARDVCQIPQDATVILFVAYRLDSPVKGLGTLASALDGVRPHAPLCLVTGGEGTPPVDVPARHLNVGYEGNERVMALLYAAADLVAVPSVLDNLPSTVLEAMACGVPVVGSAVGGIRDMIRPDETGLLVPPGDVGALRDAIQRLLDNRDICTAMAAEARRVAVAEYDRSIEGRRILELYKAMMAGSPTDKGVPDA
jgi:glycosyltransferase involved in cell wall biosynthesis